MPSFLLEEKNGAYFSFQRKVRSKKSRGRKNRDEKNHLCFCLLFKYDRYGFVADLYSDRSRICAAEALAFRKLGGRSVDR